VKRGDIVFVELHLLQNFAPSCLNRDDTNAPKDAEFGGYRRARISSQCIKRSIRRHFEAAELLPKEQLATRTKRLLDELSARVKQSDMTEEDSRAVVEMVLKGAGLNVKEDGKTEYLLFLGQGEIAGLTRLISERKGPLLELVKAQRAVTGDKEKQEEGKKKTSREKKKEAREALPDDIKKAAQTLLDGGKAVDLALFGRMLADLPGRSSDAACQVAHALSTNRASMEMDYYTAVDDLKPEDTAGADMIGTVEFNSSCFYRYANIDFDQLVRNLQGDEKLAHTTVEAFMRSAVEAIPTGKQNSMAAHNPPSFIFAVVRQSGLWSLANAFVQPVRPTREESLVRRSIMSLDDYWGRLVNTFGDGEITARGVCLVDDVPLKNLAAHKVESYKEVTGKVQAALKETGKAVSA
jgi:CRISPR system Cascade subunit CasC